MDALLDDVTDPSDWKHDFAVFRELDASLRCDLCFDIYKNPVSIKSCEHTFCSECIRTHINQSGNTGSFCPKCRQSKAYDSELVPQPVLETTALEWVKARVFLARLQQQKQERRSHTHPRQASEQASSSNLASPIANGREGQAEEESTPPRRSKRTRTEVHPRSGRAAGSKSSPFTLDDDDEDDDAGKVIDENGIVAMDNQDGSAQNPAKVSMRTMNKQRQLKPSDTVACPICNHEFTVTALNRHLDTDKCFPGCPAPTAEQQGFASTITASSAPFGSARSKGGSSWFTSAASATTPVLANGKRRARPQYQLKTERELRALLGDVDLPTTGDRDTMINRHRQWINIWNANLDSTRARKSAGQLRKELAQWEKTRMGAKDHSAVVERQKSSWTSTNKSQFDELIKTARDGAARNKKLREQKPEETQDTSDDQAPAAQGKGVAATLAVSEDDDDVEAVVD